jgi:predicted nucleotidyltransferase component of viral defense system
MFVRFRIVIPENGLLYRLSQSAYCDKFVLKGAALFAAWLDKPHRATQDIDLLGLTDNSIPHVEQVFREICRLKVEEDGLEFKKIQFEVSELKKDRLMKECGFT